MNQTSSIITKSLQPNLELDEEEGFVGATCSFFHNTKTGAFVAAYTAYPSRGEFARDFVGSIMNTKKEKLYVEALRNLYKKVDFLELSQALENKEINENEFEKELSLNESKYLIPYPGVKPDAIQVFLVSDIVQKIGRVKDMTVDEASELFQLDLSAAENVLEEMALPPYFMRCLFFQWPVR